MKSHPHQQFSTLWLLMGQFGSTMTMEQLRDTYFPTVTMKTMSNKASRGELPPRTGDVFDVRDVSAWWDSRRAQSQAVAA